MDRVSFKLNYNKLFSLVESFYNETSLFSNEFELRSWILFHLTALALWRWGHDSHTMKTILKHPIRFDKFFLLTLPPPTRGHTQPLRRRGRWGGGGEGRASDKIYELTHFTSISLSVYLFIYHSRASLQTLSLSQAHTAVTRTRRGRV